jgi:hypothetical protein
MVRGLLGNMTSARGPAVLAGDSLPPMCVGNIPLATGRESRLGQESPQVFQLGRAIRAFGQVHLDSHYLRFGQQPQVILTQNLALRTVQAIECLQEDPLQRDEWLRSCCAGVASLDVLFYCLVCLAIYVGDQLLSSNMHLAPPILS